MLRTCDEYKIPPADELFTLVEDQLDSIACGSKEIRFIELFVALFEKLYADKKNMVAIKLKISDPVVMKARRKKADGYIAVAKECTGDSPVDMFRYYGKLKGYKKRQVSKYQYKNLPWSIQRLLGQL